MSLGVQSYPELYTMLLGWDMYGKLWGLLTQTGIVYLPFIGIILKNVAHSYTHHGHHGAEHGLRGMEINLITALLLIFFGAAPFMRLDAHTISYSPMCGSDKGSTYYPGSTGTTYDKAFAIPDGDIRVPLWWYAVMSVSEGMTSAANTFVGCVPDLRKMVTEVNMTQVSDPETKQELQDFETMCYAPARTSFFNDSRAGNSSNLDRIQDNVKKYGVGDTEWLGSHSFGDIYYRNVKSARPVPGFPYESSQDINSDTNKLNPPAFGTPSCYEWWNDKEHGLKNRLYQALPKSFGDDFKDFVNSEKTHDDVIKRIITNASSGYSSANSAIGDIGYSHLVSSIGIWYHQIEAYPKIYAAGQAAPIIQALLLLMIYVFLPFALVFGGYNPSGFIAGALLIFSLIFWTFIWHLVSWADKSLMQALYTNWFSQQGAGATLVDMIIGTFVVIAPLFWLSFMGAMGVAVSDIVSSMVLGLSKIGEKAAGSGVSGTKTIAKTAVKTAAL